MGFRNFTVPLWEIFAGNLSFLLCSLFYLAWWSLTHRPDHSGAAAAGGVCLALTLITGVAALLLLSAGIMSLTPQSRGVPVKFVLLGGIALWLIMLWLTTSLLHRPLTAELIIIFIWVIAESAALVVLNGTGRFGPMRTVSLAILIGLATVAAMICYVIHYRLDSAAAYWNGMIPLIIDAVVLVVFQVMLVAQ